jgi:hypothetical protein
MKILFSLPLELDEKQQAFVKEASKHLKKSGHNISDTKLDIKNQGKSFSKHDKSLKDCDALIADISFIDSKVGYEIARAVDERKVIIIMSNDNISEHITLPVLYTNSKQIVIQEYSDNTVVNDIDKAISIAQSKMDSKFILIISAEMDRYLNWASKEKRIHKAQIVRTALEEMIKKDREYSKYNG